MSEKNKALVYRWFEEVWNQGKSEVIDELMAKDGVVHGLADAEGNAISGTDGFHRFHDQFRGAFPDIVVNVEDICAEGDKVVARCSVRATHTGESLGFAATNAPIEIEGVAIVRIENEKIAEAWNHFDFLAMNRQLGVL